MAAPSRHVVASRRSCPAQRSRAGAKGQAAGHSLIPGGLGKSLGSSNKKLYEYLSMDTYQCHTYFFDVLVLMFEVGIWLVVSTILKNMKVNGKGLSHMAHIYIMENNPHVPNHQPDNEIELSLRSLGWKSQWIMILKKQHTKWGNEKLWTIIIFDDI